MLGFLVKSMGTINVNVEKLVCNATPSKESFVYLPRIYLLWRCALWKKGLGTGLDTEGTLRFRAHGAGALKGRTLSVGTTMNGGDLAETPKINKETL